MIPKYDPKVIQKYYKSVTESNQAAPAKAGSATGLNRTEKKFNKKILTDWRNLRTRYVINQIELIPLMVELVSSGIFTPVEEEYELQEPRHPLQVSTEKAADDETSLLNG